MRGLRTCPGCGREYAMLYICERCGRCDERDLPRDADREAACCSKDGACVERDWRADVEPKHITDQRWIPEPREDGVYLIDEDGSAIVKLCRPDRDSDLMIAGYIAGLQAHQLTRFTRDNKNTAADHDVLAAETCRLSHHQRKYPFGCSIPDCPRYSPREASDPSLNQPIDHMKEKP